MDMITDAEIQGDSGGGQKKFGYMQLLYHVQRQMPVEGFFTGHIKAAGQDSLKAFFAG